MYSVCLCLNVVVLMARVGSVLPAAGKTPSRCILARATASGLIITFLHTKIIQFVHRLLHNLLLRTVSPLCPVAAYAHASALVADHLSAPAFSFTNADGVTVVLRK